MNRRREVVLMAAGVLTGMMLSGPAAHAAEALSVQLSTQKFYVDGQRADLTAYNIDGHNYVQLADLSPLVGFDLTYDGSTNSVYIGEQPVSKPAATGTVQLPTDGSKYVPQAGDIIQCDDGTKYTITDVSRWENSAFSPGPLPGLPSAACDWSRFPTLALPKVEARHFSNDTGEVLFVRNLYETRRMQYTIYNVLGSEPSAWKDGTPLATVQMSIPDDLQPYSASFWPWRASELEKLVHSRPNSQYYVEAWDSYLNGVFQYTRYAVVSI